MRARHTALVFAVVSTSAASCSRDKPEQAAATASASATASATATASAPVSASASASVSAPVSASASAHDELRLARITSASVVGWNRPGVLAVTLALTSSPEPASAFVFLAVDQNPIGFRRPLAFEKLGAALGMRVVPATALRRISTGELGRLFAASADLRDYFNAHAAVQNDGTVDALVMAPSRGEGASAFRLPKGRELSLDSSIEAKTWAQAVASLEPNRAENTELLRDYVEALVLDYLSGNVLRRVAFLDEQASALHLTSNDSAFPSKVDPRALDLLLARLRPVKRFPRGLRAALSKLNRAAARELLAPTAFTDWLVSPRTLVDLDERRKSVLTLVEARIGESGEARVLCL
jgi:hypothetical protein